MVRMKMGHVSLHINSHLDGITFQKIFNVFPLKMQTKMSCPLDSFMNRLYCMKEDGTSISVMSPLEGML